MFSETEKMINDLDDRGYYYAYVTFQRDLNFDQITNLMEEWENREVMMGLSWLGVRTEENNYFTNNFFGYENQMSGNIMRGWDQEKYPELFVWTQEMAENSMFDEIDKKFKDEETMKKHFQSMLRYMADQKKFLEMMGRTPEEYESALAYVEEHGLSYYGFAAIMDKETMQEVMKQEEVLCIYPVQYD